MTDTAPAIPTPPANFSNTEITQATTGGDGLTLAQHRESIEFGLSRGFISREQAEAALVAAGDKPLEAPPAQNSPPDEPTEVSPSNSPGDYKMPDLNSLEMAVSGKEITNAEIMQVQETVGGWFSKANIAPDMASAKRIEV